MKRNYTIDLFRLIASFFILCLHTDFGNLNPIYIEDIRLSARWALPVFFMISGCFLGKKIQDDYLPMLSIEKNIIHLISLLIISSIVYLPIDIVSHSTSFNHVSVLFTGTSFHLWFIGSLLFGYIFIWYFYSLKWLTLLNIITVLILIFCLITDSYDLFFGRHLSFELGQFLLSIPFLNIGVLMSTKKVSARYVPLLIVLIGIGFYIELKEADYFFSQYGYSRREHQFLIGTVLLTISLFILCISVSIRKNILSVWGHKYSLFIYLYHIAMFFIMDSIFKRLFHSEFNTIRIFYPFIAFIFTLLSAIVLNTYFPFIFKLLNGNFGELSIKKQKG